jgi:ribosomal-protein-alanine N-acetyltransferase
MLDWLFGMPDRQPQPLAGEGLVLRRPVMEDFAQWRRLREESRDFLQPWEPRWPHDDLTQSGFRARIRRYRREAAEASGFTYFVFDAPSGELLGGLGLTNLRWGAGRSAQLGYWMGERHAGKSVMGRAVRLACAAAFEALALERVEAACLPGNERSVRLLEHAGFEREGRASDYLEINGERRDHLLYALTRARYRQIGSRGDAQRAAGH